MREREREREREGERERERGVKGEEMRYDRNCHCMYVLHSDITVALSTCLNVHVLRCVHTCSTCTHTGIHTPQAL